MKHRHRGFDIAFWFVAALIILNVIAFDIATGRLADPFKLFSIG